MHSVSRILQILLSAICLAVFSGCWKVDVITDLADQRDIHFDYAEQVTFESIAGPAMITVNGVAYGPTPVTVRVPFGVITAKQQGECVVIIPSDYAKDSPYGGFKFDFIGNGYTPKSYGSTAYLFIGVIGEDPKPTRWTGAIVVLRKPAVTVTGSYPSGGTCQTRLEPRPPETAFQIAFEQAGLLSEPTPEHASITIPRRIVLTGPDGTHPATAPATAPSTQTATPPANTAKTLPDLD